MGTSSHLHLVSPTPSDPRKTEERKINQSFSSVAQFKDHRHYHRHRHHHRHSHNQNQNHHQYHHYQNQNKNPNLNQIEGDLRVIKGDIYTAAITLSSLKVIRRTLNSIRYLAGSQCIRLMVKNGSIFRLAKQAWQRHSEGYITDCYNPTRDKCVDKSLSTLS